MRQRCSYIIGSKTASQDHPANDAAARLPGERQVQRYSGATQPVRHSRLDQHCVRALSGAVDSLQIRVTRDPHDSPDLQPATPQQGRDARRIAPVQLGSGKPTIFGYPQDFIGRLVRKNTQDGNLSGSGDNLPSLPPTDSPGTTSKNNAQIRGSGFDCAAASWPCMMPQNLILATTPLHLR